MPLHLLARDPPPLGKLIDGGLRNAQVLGDLGDGHDGGLDSAMGCLNVGPVPWGSRARGLTPFHEQCSLLLIAAASAMAPLSQVCSNSRRPWPSLAKRRGRARLSRESAGCWRAPRAPPGWVAARLSLAKQAPLPARQPSQLRSWGCHRLPSSRPPLSRTSRPGATGPQPRRAAGGHAGGRGCGGWRRRASGDPQVIGQVGNPAAERSPRPLRGGPRPGRHGIARCRSIPGGEQRGTVKGQS